MNNNKGFTVIELILVIIILSIIARVGGLTLSQGLESYRQAQSLQDAQFQGQLALTRMTRDLQAIPYDAAITTATASQLTYTDASGNNVTYQLSGSQLMRNSEVLADGISSLSFTYYTSLLASGATSPNIRGIRVQFTVTQNNISIPLRTFVSPRNFL